MAVSAELRALVDQMPDADSRNMLTEDIDKDRIEKVLAALASGGRESFVGLIEMLDQPGSDPDLKPHYALHGLANHVLVTKNEAGRRELCETMAAALSNDHSTYIKSFLCQELQWAGRQESVAALGRLLEDPQLVEPASMALVAIGPDAAEQFRAVLPRAPRGCRLHIVQALGGLEDTKSVDALRQALDDDDPEVRLAAGWGLARMGDAGSLDLLIKAADGSKGWERIQATKHCLMLAEQLRDTQQGTLAARIYTHLRDTRTDPAEHYIRDAAQVALRPT
jgi:hypothetical protein